MLFHVMALNHKTRDCSLSLTNYFYKNAFIYRFVGWYFFINALIFWVLGAGYLKAILSSTTLFKNLHADYSSLFGKIVVLFFTLVNYLSFMMLLAYIPAIFVFLVALLMPKKPIIWIMSSVAASVSVILLLIDSQVYSMFKFHLNSTVLTFFFSRQWTGVFDLSHYELFLLSSMGLVVVVLECAIIWFVWKKIILPKRFKAGKAIVSLWLGGILFSYFTLLFAMSHHHQLFSQQTANLPLFNDLLAYVIPGKNARDRLLRLSEHDFSQPVFSNDQLNYPHQPMHCSAPEKPYNIILIMVDSLRFDSMQSKYMPNVMQFSAQSWEFLNHVSGGNSTQPGLFSLFYSLPGSYWTAMLNQEVAPVFINLLKKFGYSTQVIWSSEMHHPPFDKTIYQGLKNLNRNGAPGEDIGNRDRYITKEAIKFLSSEKSKKPFFMNLFYDAPHGFCAHQSFPTVFQPVHEKCSRIYLTNETDPLLFYNRYLNAVNFVDVEVGKLLNAIEEHGFLDDSVVIFTSDHGQEFNDNKQNYWGHTSNFTPTQVQIPLIIHWPGEPPRQVDYLTSSYDVVPTLLQRLFSCSNPVSDYSIGHDLMQAEGRLSFLLTGSYVSMGIIEPDRLTTLESSGRITITTRKAEPLPAAKPRKEVINKALSLMRVYYVGNL